MLKSLNSSPFFKSFTHSRVAVIGILFIFYFVSSFSSHHDFELKTTVVRALHQLATPLQTDQNMFALEAMLEDTEDEDEGEHRLFQINQSLTASSFFNEFVYTASINSLFNSLMLSYQEKSYIPIFIYQHRWKSYLS